jgi:hypothetical protein
MSALVGFASIAKMAAIALSWWEVDEKEFRKCFLAAKKISRKRAS